MKLFKSFFTESELDYLNNDKQSYDFLWEDFFNYYHDYLVLEIHDNESITIIKDEIINSNRRHVEYEFKVDGNKFVSIIDVVTCESEIDSLNEDVVKFKMKRKPISEIEDLLEVYKNNPKKYVVKYRFVDDTNNSYISNKMGNLAFLVLRLASKAMLKVFNLIEFDNVQCLEFNVVKSEIKRLDLYKKIIEKENIGFDGSFTDNLTDSKYITYYAFKKQ